jgi:hypothetical protein
MSAPQPALRWSINIGVALLGATLSLAALAMENAKARASERPVPTLGITGLSITPVAVGTHKAGLARDI